MLRLGLVAGTVGQRERARRASTCRSRRARCPTTDMTEHDLVTLASDGERGGGPPASPRASGACTSPSTRPAPTPGRSCTRTAPTPRPGASSASRSTRHRGARRPPGAVYAPCPHRRSDEIASAAVAALGDRGPCCSGATACWRSGDSPRAGARRCRRCGARGRRWPGCCARRGERPRAGQPAPARARHRRRRRRGRSARHRRGAAAAHGARPVLGGVSWERRPIDPRARSARRRARSPTRGARAGRAAAPSAARACAPVACASPRRAWPSCSARRRCWSTPTPARPCWPTASRPRWRELDCDLAVFVDVGGDVLAARRRAGAGQPALRLDPARRGGARCSDAEGRRCWAACSGSAATAS